MSIISDPKQFNPLQPEWGGEETEEKPSGALKSIVAIGASAGGLRRHSVFSPRLQEHYG